MKTQEEIEQLSIIDLHNRQKLGHYELADLKSRDYYYDGFTNGYTQCQEDMADKKYTEEDIRQVFEFGLMNNFNLIERDNDNFKYFINLLNKQD